MSAVKSKLAGSPVVSIYRQAILIGRRVRLSRIGVELPMLVKVLELYGAARDAFAVFV